MVQLTLHSLVKNLSANYGNLLISDKESELVHHCGVEFTVTTCVKVVVVVVVVALVVVVQYH